jgi:hypothetical protein
VKLCRPLVLILSLTTLPTAQAASRFEGYVRTKGSKAPLKQISLFILPQKIRIQTDERGFFRTEEIPEGAFEWVINASNHERYTQNDQSSADPKVETRDFYLEPLSSGIFETTITAQETNDDSRQTLKTKKALSLPGAGLDAVRAVQNLPGVNRSSGFSARVIVQGSAPQETRYQIDGHEVPIIFHFGGLSSVVSPEMLESVDFYAAGYQANFGRALGGIINLQTATPFKERWRGSAFLDVFNVGGHAEGPIGEKSALSFAGRYSYIGPVLGAVAKASDSFSLTTAPTFYDLSSTFTTEFSDELRFKLFATASKDELKFVTAKGFGEDPFLRGSFRNEVSFFRFIPQLLWKPDSKTDARFSVGIGQDSILNEIGDQFFDLTNTAVTTRGQYTKTLADGLWKASVGIDSRFNWTDLDILLPNFVSQGGILNPLSTGETRQASLRGETSHQIGVYTNHEIRPGENSPWSITPGLRFDYYENLKAAELSPRLAGKYKWAEHWSIRAATGLYSQQPQNVESSRDYGNPNLKPTRAVQATLGAERDLSLDVGQGSKVYSGVFGRWFNQLVVPDSTTIYSNAGKGRAIGWENLITVESRPWFGWVSYMLSRSTRWSPSQPEYLSQFDQTHLLTLIGGVELPRRWKISTRFRYVTGTLVTPVTGSVFDADNDAYIPIRGTFFSQRQAPFYMVDLRIDKQWVFTKWTLSLYLDIQNLLNRANPEGLQYSFDYSASESVAGYPILPTFGLKGEF